jgi:sugar fermentation stimulation protein A
MTTSIQPCTFRGLPWPQLISGTLIRRYKRFLADVLLKNGDTVTAHCPNTGSMKGCSEPGRTVYLSIHNNPKRKLKYTWELIEMPGSLVGVNTLVPNRLLFESIKTGQIPELSGYDTLEAEVSIGNHSRIDLMLSGSGKGPCYLEVKNCTLVSDGVACFPDAVTARGLKHIQELGKLKAAGFRTVMFYFIQRMDAEVFKPADHIDAAYGRELRQAVNNGLEVLAYDVLVDFKHIRLHRHIPCEL